jgi:glycosyltransferase involved in cell wall biosynthesis
VPGDALEVRLEFRDDGRDGRVRDRARRRALHAGRLSLADGTPFRVCAVIPTYDNALTVRDAVLAARAHVTDVVLVDDGSGPPARAACEAIAAEGLAQLVRLERNGGKGAAVKAGFAAARARGFTHAFQVDADGQHDAACMPEFLRCAREHPEALVLGYPAFDASAPRLRQLGHRFGAFWIDLELGRGHGVVDTQCGFRIYPLDAALAAGARSDHMDFDIEIVVRMARGGAPVINRPVGVRYLSAQAGGISHFQPLRDNARLFRLHSRLCTEGMLGWACRGLGFIGPERTRVV